MSVEISIIEKEKKRWQWLEAQVCSFICQRVQWLRALTMHHFNRWYTSWRATFSSCPCIRYLSLAYCLSWPPSVRCMALVNLRECELELDEISWRERKKRVSSSNHLPFLHQAPLFSPVFIHCGVIDNTADDHCKRVDHLHAPLTKQSLLHPGGTRWAPFHLTCRSIVSPLQVALSFFSSLTMSSNHVQSRESSIVKDFLLLPSPFSSVGSFFLLSIHSSGRFDCLHLSSHHPTRWLVNWATPHWAGRTITLLHHQEDA